MNKMRLMAVRLHDSRLPGSQGITGILGMTVGALLAMKPINWNEFFCLK
jgi:hypothetical protein